MKTPTDSSRQFFPKGTNLGDLSQTTLNDVARTMNTPPQDTGMEHTRPSHGRGTRGRKMKRRTSNLNPKGAHGVRVLNGAGWHGAKALQVPDNITLFSATLCA